LYQLCRWPRFIVVHPACASVARVVGFATAVGVVGGLASDRPVAIRVQVSPPLVLFKYAAVAGVKPMLVS
jgi:hypothetical protein